jgi:hypothetical protein
MITPVELVWYLNGRDQQQRTEELCDLLQLGLVETVLTSSGFQLIRTPAGDASTSFAISSNANVRTSRTLPAS